MFYQPNPICDHTIVHQHCHDIPQDITMFRNNKYGIIIIYPQLWSVETSLYLTIILIWCVCASMSFLQHACSYTAIHYVQLQDCHLCKVYYEAITVVP